MAKKFPLGRVKELAAHVKGLHEHLQSLIADCDSTSDDAPVKSAASDNADADQPYAQGQDSARRVSSDTGRSMDQMITNARSGVSR